MSTADAPAREVVREVDFEPAVPKAGILTTEFWTSIAVLASNILLGLVMFGKLEQNDAKTLTDAISAICTGLPLILANVVVIWKYVSNRTAVKTAAIQETTRRLEMRETLRMQLRQTQMYLTNPQAAMAMQAAPVKDEPSRPKCGGKP